MRTNPFHLASRRNHQRGITLVELILFLVIVGIGLAGILSVINLATRASADPVMRKQALALAESLLAEVQLQSFLYCDPSDPAAATATSIAACTVAAVTKTRYSASAPFNRVSDYDGFVMNDATGGIRDITNTPVGLAGYAARIVVAGTALAASGSSAGIPSAAAVLISVTVTSPDQSTVSLEGIRTRYAPNGY
ncbi:prepilin-type N-terminal cleavage/methylation domain-containing protein [Actimicrobium sp. CCC2.4]|uniref:type IV pilus modification PilV family protein n=1 Tax=Actimicrobium sp. CCC2.4 TaxID=3048606 RepID=UPI002AC905C3|nr:prepilin-type N-terminal cleavage/methylation domain-containing protein [Actimicrobium sp. CCC2.4]MEB0134701.1 prepilin-type N-terminal cleavage/methylation domain-containing protein [Actimicrobium sp. CCC2.4]WPX30644.1 prepilin-type N-terminal cleavage/methylation domain-containing protein [Actimicrobium sp. CCC2.4]